MTTTPTNFRSMRIDVITELKPSALTVEPNQADGTHTSASELIDRSDLENYQIALVPVESGPATSSRPSTRHGITDRLLILPWTWKDFVTHVRTGKDNPSPSEKNYVAEFGTVRVDFLSMELRRSGELVCLTALEFKVLKFFVSSPNQVISRELLLNEVWGYDNYPCTRTVDNLILRLRRKLEIDFANPVHFRTVHGTGYKFIP